MIVACYVRVSTENQLENYSIEEQTERLQLYCKSKDYIIYNMYIDGGFSGGNMNRPALQQLIRDVENKKVNAVLVYKLDRLSRSQKDTLTIIEDKFLKNDVDFISLNENFDTSTPFGKAMIGILSVFAQLEKDQITERFTMGRIGRSKAGYYHGGSTAPTGYDYKDGLLVVNPITAPQVREVYRDFLAGKSINAIQKQMHQKYGGWGSASLVLNVLRNSVYIGKVKFKKTEYQGIHESIISEEEYNQVQEYLKSDKRSDFKTYTKTPFKAKFMLTSLIFCQRCGARFAAEHGNYTCYSRSKGDKRKIKDPNCKNDKWKINELDELILDEIHLLSTSQQKIDELIKNKKHDKPIDEKYLLSQISDIDQQIKRVLDLYQIGTISMESISERLKELESKKDMLQNQLKQNQIEKHSKESLQRFKSLVSQIDYMREQPVETKRLYVSELIESIWIDGKNININWRL